MDKFDLSQAEKEVDNINRGNIMAEQSEEICRLKSQLEELKLEKDNLYGQKTKMTETPRTDDKYKTDLERVKAANHFLLEDNKSRKQQLKKAQTETFELNLKLEAANKKNADLLKEMKVISYEVQELLQDRLELELIREENKRFREYLKNYHIDPRSGKKIPGHMIGKSTTQKTDNKKISEKKKPKVLSINLNQPDNTETSDTQYPPSYRGLYRESLKYK